jgi:hypothetical protein
VRAAGRDCGRHATCGGRSDSAAAQAEAAALVFDADVLDGFACSVEPPDDALPEDDDSPEPALLVLGAEAGVSPLAGEPDLW